MDLRYRTSEVGLSDYLRVLYRRRIVAILTFLVVLLSVTVHTFLMTPIYEAFCLVQIKQEQTQNILLGDLIQLGRTNQVPAEMEIIRSRTVAEAVVRELRLDVMLLEHTRDLEVNLADVNLAQEKRGQTLTVEFIDDQGRFEVLHKGDKLGEGTLADGFSIDGSQFNVLLEKAEKGDWFKFVQRPFDATVRMVQSNLGVAEVGEKTQIIKISYSSQYPMMARDIVNKTVEVYQRQNIDEKSREAQQTLKFIEGQLDIIRDNLDASEDNLKRFKQDHGIMMLSEEAGALIESTAKFEMQKAQLEIQKHQYQSMLSAIDSEGIEQASLPSLSSAEDTVLASLGLKLAELKGQKGALLSDMTENAPEVKALTQEINALGLQIRTVLKNTVASLQAQLNKLHNVIGGFDEKINALPDTERALAGLMRSSEVTNQIYTFLLQKHEEARIAKAATIGNIRIIDLAVTPKSPIKPRVRLNLLLGMVAGLLLALGMAFFLEFIDDSLKSIDEVERVIRKPVYGIIPRIPDYRKEPEAARPVSANLVTHYSPKSPISEAFRTLRTNIHFADPDQQLTSLLITSAGPSEGKSTIVSNLALTFANTGRRTLLLDCDLRKPNVHNIFETQRDPGLTNVLMKESSWKDVLRETKIPNLYMIPSGPIPPNPTEMVGSQGMKDLIEQFKTEFDLILLDSPPVVAVTDAAILSVAVDATLLVVELGRSRASGVNRAIDLLEKVKANLMGIITNNISSGYKYDYGYYSYYYYYAESGQKKKRRRRSRYGY
ncbi:MAG TPA: polysaccharide biosynthesis tyrosine autokinase [bacterium]|nr:polysaccharide biosynthesis tyrosine autokinase [bacterium]